MVRPEGIELFVSTGTLSEQEVRARYHIYLERYLKDVAIEVDTLTDMARTQVLPAAIAHQGMLAQRCVVAQGGLLRRRPNWRCSMPARTRSTCCTIGWRGSSR